MPKFAGDDYSAMQGPCPSGFHVPTKTEMQNVWDVVSGFVSGGGASLGGYLYMPMAGLRRNSDGTVSNVGSNGYYWCCDAGLVSGSYWVSGMIFSSGSVTISTGSYPTEGRQIRPFKDEIINPIDSGSTLKSGWAWTYHSGSNNYGIAYNSSEGLISLSSDGVNWYTLSDKNLGATTVYDYTNPQTSSYGNYYQWGNNYGFPNSGTITTSSTQVDASNYGPGNYYSSSTFITGGKWWDSSQNQNLRGGVTGVVHSTGEPKKIYIRVNAQPITTSGIYHNSDLGLISLSSDGSNWITISDKNLGATQVYNSGDALSEANCGKYYQWGNNYGFPYTGPTTSSTTLVNAGNYGPGNYYNSSTYIKNSSSPYNWDSSNNQNLWGDTTNTNVARRGPCAEGWHIMSESDFTSLKNVIDTLGVNTSAYLYLKIPSSGGYDQSGSRFNNSAGDIWLSTPLSNGTSAYYCVVYGNGVWGVSKTNTAKAYAFSIRPFKNEAVQPDDSRTKLY